MNGEEQMDLEQATTSTYPLLTGKQVAGILNVSISYAFQLMRTGQIPSVRIGRAIRVRVQDLLAFIDGNLSGCSSQQVSNPKLPAVK